MEKHNHLIMWVSLSLARSLAPAGITRVFALRSDTRSIQKENRYIQSNAHTQSWPPLTIEKKEFNRNQKIKKIQTRRKRFRRNLKHSCTALYQPFNVGKSKRRNHTMLGHKQQQHKRKRKPRKKKRDKQKSQFTRDGHSFFCQISF